MITRKINYYKKGAGLKRVWNGITHAFSHDRKQVLSEFETETKQLDKSRKILNEQGRKNASDLKQVSEQNQLIPKSQQNSQFAQEMSKRERSLAERQPKIKAAQEKNTAKRAELQSRKREAIKADRNRVRKNQVKATLGLGIAGGAYGLMTNPEQPTIDSANPYGDIYDPTQQYEQGFVGYDPADGSYDYYDGTNYRDHVIQSADGSIYEPGTYRLLQAGTPGRNIFAENAQAAGIDTSQTRQLQTFLAMNGLLNETDVDGYFGSKTKAAMQRFLAARKQQNTDGKEEVNQYLLKYHG